MHGCLHLCWGVPFSQAVVRHEGVSEAEVKHPCSFWCLFLPPLPQSPVHPDWLIRDGTSTPLSISLWCHGEMMLQKPCCSKNHGHVKMEGLIGANRALRVGRPFGCFALGVSKFFPGILPRKLQRGTRWEAWLSMFMFGMRAGTHSLGMHSPKDGGFGSCLLSVVSGSYSRGEMCPVEK